MTDLLVAPCSLAAARLACERWHYTGRLPMDGHAKMVRYGAWEDGRFVGTVVWTPGLAAGVHRPFEVERLQLAELARVALDRHESPASQIVAAATRLLTISNPRLLVLVSFADPH